MYYQDSRLKLLEAGDVESNPGPREVADSVRTGHMRSKNGNSDSLLVLNQNVRSIRNKLGNLRACSPELDTFDVITWTESWLDESVDTAELESALPRHAWFRRDRPTHGGGVACAVKTHLQPERRQELEAESTESLVVELRTRPASLIVTVYCPPGDGRVLTDTVQMIQRLVARYPGRTVLVVGDFNVPDVRWESHAELSIALPTYERVSQRASQLLDGCDASGLRQYVLEPTRGGNFLDLVFAKGALGISISHTISLCGKEYSALTTRRLCAKLRYREHPAHLL